MVYMGFMPSTRHKFLKCGHRGKGSICRRCDQAEKYKARAEKLKDSSEKTWLLAEARRLLSLDGKVSEPSPVT